MTVANRRVAAFAFIGERLILVKTIGVGIRIPPKGKIELGESCLDAVVREMKEEAGVIGTPRFVSDWPIARYEHVKARSGKSELNDIYLALVDERGFAPEQAELGRKPKLFTLDEAIARVDRDVVDGLRLGHSARGLIAAMTTAFACVKELRGNVPVSQSLWKTSLATNKAQPA